MPRQRPAAAGHVLQVGGKGEHCLKSRPRETDRRSLHSWDAPWEVTRPLTMSGGEQLPRNAKRPPLAVTVLHRAESTCSCSSKVEDTRNARAWGGLNDRASGQWAVDSSPATCGV